MANKDKCDHRQGALPMCSPLAGALVPMQSSAETVYDQGEALTRGTLFPGLDLPFLNFVAEKPLERTPANELAALDFVSHELALYLDTHKDDKEAFAAWKSFEALARTAHKRYAELIGPVTVTDQHDGDCWRWNSDPWPWELCGKERD